MCPIWRCLICDFMWLELWWAKKPESRGFPKDPNPWIQRFQGFCFHKTRNDFGTFKSSCLRRIPVYGGPNFHQFCEVALYIVTSLIRFRSIAKSYFRRADGVLLLYDCTYERSFMNIREWMDSIEVSDNCNSFVIVCFGAHFCATIWVPGI